MSNLMQASHEWSTRPADERFSSIEKFKEAMDHVQVTSHEATGSLKKLRLVPTEDNGIILATSKSQSGITNWAFKQLCRKLKVPSDFATTYLDNDIACDVLNHRLSKLSDDEAMSQFLLRDTGAEVTCRSITSERYGRFWSNQLAGFLKLMQAEGWRIPPARPAMQNQPGTRKATEEDCLPGQSFGLSVKPGDLIAPAGIYGSDEDMFAVMVDTNPDHQVDDGTGRKLSRGFFLSNSEVGKGSVKLVEYLFAQVCGNHIIWDATNVTEVNYRHIGDIVPRVNKALGEAYTRLTVFSRKEKLEKELASLRKIEIAPTKEETVDTLYGMRIDQKLTKAVLGSAYDYAEEYGETDGGNPNTPWGLVQGMTRLSQTYINGSDRFDIETAGGKILTKYASLATA